MDDQTRQQLYAEQMGQATLERQKNLSTKFCNACGHRLDKPHHPMCPRRNSRTTGR